MKVITSIVVGIVGLTACLPCGVGRVHAAGKPELLRETLRQQSAAGRSSCDGVQRTVAAGTDPLLVVRTGVELGYNSCRVITCALEGGAATDRETLCEKVVRGAVAAGVQPDVISRCAAACDPAVVAAVLSAAMFEPNYCYFSTRPLVAPELLPPPEPVFDRSHQVPQASPFTF